MLTTITLNGAEIKPSDNPKRIPTFGCGSKSDQIELYVLSLTDLAFITMHL